jgi:hypothetical protein
MVAKEFVEPDPLGLMITKTELGWIVHGGDNVGSIQEAIVNFCCEKSDDILHGCVKKFMSLENFGMMVKNIDRRKSEEERLSLKNLKDFIKRSIIFH